MVVNSIDIVRMIVESIDSTITGTYELESGTTYNVTTCDRKWAFVGGYFGDVVITELTSTGFKTTGQPQNMTLQAPKFFHGTVQTWNNETTQLEFLDKMPMVYMPEIFNERFFNILSKFDRDIDCRLIFAVNGDFSSWSSGDYHNYAITPLLQLVKAFIDTAKRLNGTNIEYTQQMHPKLGQYTDNKGYTTKMVNESLTGVIIDTTLQINKKFKCNCNGL